MAVEPGLIRIEVAYALPDRQFLVPIDLPEGATVEEALLRSDIAERAGGLDLAGAELGIFGRRVEDPKKERLSDGDRVEIYRPLRMDPMESRRRRAKARAPRG